MRTHSQMAEVPGAAVARLPDGQGRQDVDALGAQPRRADKVGHYSARPIHDSSLSKGEVRPVEMVRNVELSWVNLLFLLTTFSNHHIVSQPR